MLCTQGWDVTATVMYDGSAKSTAPFTHVGSATAPHAMKSRYAIGVPVVTGIAVIRCSCTAAPAAADAGEAVNTRPLARPTKVASRIRRKRPRRVREIDFCTPCLSAGQIGTKSRTLSRANPIGARVYAPWRKGRLRRCNLSTLRSLSLILQRARIFSSAAQLFAK